MSTAKLLGITIRSDFKWKDHIDIITVKAAKLKKAGIGD